MSDDLKIQSHSVIHDLSAFGHRGSASAHERRAAEYLGTVLKDLGMETNRQPFRGARSHAARLLVHLLAAAAALALVFWSPQAATALIVLTLVSLVAEQMTFGDWMGWIVSRYRSSNVIGRLAASRPPRLRIVLSAHYDTQKSGWVWAIARRLHHANLRSPLFFRQPLIPVVCLMIAQLVSNAAILTLGLSMPLRTVAALIAFGYAVALVLFVQWAAARAVPGAADNASGVATVLAVAKRWSLAQPAEDVELVVLLPGCEESGLTGAAHWARQHLRRSDPIETVVVNIDGVGFGPPRFLGTELAGIGWPLHAPPTLIGLCSQIAAQQNLRDAGPHAINGPTDGLAFLAHGIQAVTIVGFQDGQRLPHYHTMADTAENVDYGSVVAAVEFASAIVEKLAQNEVA